MTNQTITHKLMPALVFSVYNEDNLLLTNETLVFKNHEDKAEFEDTVRQIRGDLEVDWEYDTRIQGWKVLRAKAAQLTGHYPSLRLCMSLIDNGLMNSDSINIATDSSSGC